MIFPVKADLIGLLEGAVASIQPFAKAHGVELSITSTVKTLEALYQPEQILPDFTQLICRVITFTPQGYTVSVQARDCEEVPSCIKIIIVNQGSNLCLLGDISSGLSYAVNCQPQSEGSEFTMRIPLDLTQPQQFSPPGRHEIIRPWYNEIRKRLTAHFQSVENLQEAAHEKGPQEGIFLQKVNAVISSNLSNELFNTSNLADAMALSRTQLFRKLKLLVQMSPSRYIRFVRMLKAKEILEQGDHNISEVTFMVGFVSASHFTRVFQKHFGFNPSSIKG